VFIGMFGAEEKHPGGKLRWARGHPGTAQARIGRHGSVGPEAYVQGRAARSLQ
jgi:hypothetical protein